MNIEAAKLIEQVQSIFCAYPHTGDHLWGRLHLGWNRSFQESPDIRGNRSALSSISTISGLPDWGDGDCRWHRNNSSRQQSACRALAGIVPYRSLPSQSLHVVLRCSIQWDFVDDTSACVEARASNRSYLGGVVSFWRSAEVGKLMDSPIH